VGVYWAAQPDDGPDTWPESVPLPDNVHVFPRGYPAGVTFHRGDEEITRIIGAGDRHRGRIAAGEFRPDPTGLFTIAVAHGPANAAGLKSRGIHYWALGGRHARTTLFAAEHVAHYPGTTQGRHPKEPGPHGCTLVQVEPGASPRLSFIATDVLRWHAERVVVDAQTTRAGLEAMLIERRNALAQSAGGTELLIEWRVSGSGPLLAAIRQGALGGDLLNALRADTDGGDKVWSFALAAEPAPVLEPHWYEQETILGDFLRMVRDCQTGASHQLNLSTLLGDESQDEELTKWAALDDPEVRQRILRQTAALGLDLLAAD
jgi:hypothetical protein